MSARTTAIGFALIGALAFIVFATGSASAMPTGYTAFTCKKVEAGGTFTAPHCKSSDAGSGNYAHVGFTGSTSVTGSNEGTASGTFEATPTIFKGTVSLTKTTINCRTESAKGTLSNGIEAEEMFSNGVAVLTYGSCTVTEPIRGCVVKGGSITTKELAITTKGQGMGLKISPASGTTIAEVTIEGCASGLPPNGISQMTGSWTVPEVEASGATLSTSEAQLTEANTLKWAGVKAGIEGSVTLKGPSGAGIGMTTYPYKEGAETHRLHNLHR